MTKYGSLCLIILGNLILLSCKNNYFEPLSFEISTSGCYKSCPILDAKLENNVVYYKLIKYNKAEGFFEYKLTEKNIIKLNSLINSVLIDSLEEEYSSNMPDVQEFNTKFNINGIEKNVYFLENEAPQNYQELIDFIISFKDHEIKIIDTTFNITTRYRMPFNETSIPPRPKNSK